MKLKIWWLSTVLALVVAVGGGCIAAALVVGAGAAVGAVEYKNGQLRTTDAITVQTGYNSAQAAAKDLGLVVETQQFDALAASIEARGAGDKKITIKVTNKGDKLTEIGIRVGTFGDETMSRQILEKMKSHYSDPDTK